MLSPKTFYEILLGYGIDFYCGVPDSLLKDFCFFISEHVSKNKHIITANEGNAVALAAGHYLASNKPALVYMQNSGLGNAVNPLVSMLDPKIYGIPVLLLIGWRGEPGTEDEPQHIKQGEITLKMLDTMGIPYSILSKSTEEVTACIQNACEIMEKNNCPFALIVKKNTFDEYKPSNLNNDYELSREESIKCIVDELSSKDVVISTTGKTSRELFEYRKACGSNHEKDFLTVGSMGHASSIALGIALRKPNLRIYCIDGDGAALMHLGAMGLIGSSDLSNLIHIIINNGIHESVGGQVIAAPKINFSSIAESCGYKKVICIETKKKLKDELNTIKNVSGPVFIEIKVNTSSRKNLGRPTAKPVDNKQKFMMFLNKFR